MSSRFQLPAQRTELSFTDSKPLYSKTEALAEAQRCLYCYDAPCTKACPTGIDVPGFIRKIATGNVRGAAETILDANVFGFSCARVCPVEVLCVGACVLRLQYRTPIEIGRLQRYATEPFVGTDVLRKSLARFAGRTGHTGRTCHTVRTGRKIALVGAGPASIACAHHLVGLGHKPIIFEKRGVPGGLNLSGIAPYKMHAHDCLREVEWILSSGIDLRTGVEIGKDMTCERLLKEYDAIFIGVGLGKDSSLGVPGEKGPGVLSAIETIEKIKLDSSFRFDGVESAAVVGGGNTAIDIARELAHLGIGDVSILYRRTEEEMPGYAHELKAARVAGVRFIEKTLPVRVLRENGKESSKSRGLVVARAEKARHVPGTEREFETQMVVVAIGQVGETELISKFPDVKCDSNGCAVVDEKTGRTGNPRVFAGGDCVNGGKEVVNAVAEGKRAAVAIAEMLRE